AAILSLLFLLLLVYLNLSAHTAHRILALIQPQALAEPVFFVDTHAGTQTQTQIQTQTQTQTKAQTQTQTQTRSQSQSQTQTQTQPQSQPLYIGFPMQITWKFKASGPLIAQPQVDAASVYCVSKDGIVYRINQSDHTQIWKRNIGDVVEEA